MSAHRKLVGRSIVFALVAFWFSPIALTDEPWDWVTDDAIVVVSIQQPGQLAKFVDSVFREELESEAFLSLLTDEPFPLLSSAQATQAISLLDKATELLESLESITFFSTRLGDDFDYCLVLKFTDTEDADAVKATNLKDTSESYSEEIRSRLSAVPEPKENLDSDNLKPKFEPEYIKYKTEGDVDTMARFAMDLSHRLMSSNVVLVNRYLVISNSKQLSDETVQGIKKLDGRFLAESRRFLRCFQLDKRKAHSGISCYVVPAEVLPFIDKKYSRDVLKQYGVTELVGAFAHLMVSSENDEAFIRSHVRVPFTVPRTGVAEIWSANKPLIKLPDVQAFFENHPNCIPDRIIASRLDSKERLKAIKETFRRNGQLNLFEQQLKSQAKPYGGDVQLYINRENGKTFLVRFSEEDRFRRLKFNGHDNFDDARRFVKLKQEYENKLGIPKQVFEIGGYDGWFYNEANAQKQAELDGEAFDEFDNMGTVVADQWRVHGRKDDVESLIEFAIEESPASDVLKAFSPAASRFVETHSPTWLEMRIGGARNDILIRDLRYQYYRGFMSEKYARRSGLFSKSGEVIPIKTVSDRMYAVSEFVAATFLERLGMDICGFGVFDKHFEWNWDWNEQPSSK